MLLMLKNTERGEKENYSPFQQCMLIIVYLKILIFFLPFSIHLDIGHNVRGVYLDCWLFSCYEGFRNIDIFLFFHLLKSNNHLSSNIFFLVHFL